MITESFWEYSCRVYSADEVSEACLHLQDAYGMDVNLLLLCCWHASTRGVIEQTLFSSLLTTSKAWSDNVVVPLRESRRWMKAQLAQQSLPSAVTCDQFTQLREQIKTIELRCEQHQQTFLQDLLTSTPISLSQTQQLEAAARNVQTLLLQQELPADDALHQACSALICNVIPHPLHTNSTAREIVLTVLR